MAGILKSALVRTTERPARAASLIEATDLAGDLVSRLKAYSAMVKLLDLSPQGGHLDSLTARELAELLHSLNEGAQAAAAHLATTLDALAQAGAQEGAAA